ncbi:proline hydroxylase [Idiomarina tyrosinivorans]|uniref:Proline hydroxylase n=1 Tax=Idiomarina tyrosinivorans TaxID=1445662 RepID=A0A432ZTB2_9GAMM|nr:2OG-Fe(II) oxygenase [Idiomarina tyrosinivorans]RUO81139.1 proline hydroxylase [Idiomarina tyrosinivorans]
MVTAELHRHIADELANNGYAIIDDFLEHEQALGLHQYALSLADQHWHQAAIGRAEQQAINTMVRRDRILWLSPTQPIEAAYLARMNALKLALNRELFMGLFDYECHLAHYPSGAFYKKHLDAFVGRSNRVLSTVAYLNPEWHDNDGGALVIYDDRDQVLQRVTPKLGRLVIFLSTQFVHEVERSFRDRFSVTGWFRVNASVSGIVDPPR